MDDKFAGKTVLVTGAANGLGKEIAMAFAEQGARLFLVDIDGQNLNAASSFFADHGHDCGATTADLSDECAIADVARQYAASHDGLDVLVNNAGLAYGEIAHGFLGLGMEKWASYFALNTIAPLLLAEALRPQLAAAKGIIINQSSMASHIPATAYGVTKAALNAMTYGMAAQFADDEIRCVGIAPGLMATEASEGNLAEEAKQRLRVMQMAPKRHGVARDIANMALFLASEEGSFINNQIISVDGGNRMRGWRI